MPSFTDEQIREFLRQDCDDFCEALAGDPELAKREIQKRIKKLVITPKETPEGIVLEVKGDVELLRGGDVMLGGSLDGTSQHYITTSIPLVGIVLNPALPV